MALNMPVDCMFEPQLFWMQEPKVRLRGDYEQVSRCKSQSRSVQTAVEIGADGNRDVAGRHWVGVQSTDRRCETAARQSCSPQVVNRYSLPWNGLRVSDKPGRRRPHGIATHSARPRSVQSCHDHRDPEL